MMEQVEIPKGSQPEVYKKPTEPLILPPETPVPPGKHRVVMRFNIELTADVGGTENLMLLEEKARAKAFTLFRKMFRDDLDAFYDGCTIDGKELD